MSDLLIADNAHFEMENVALVTYNLCSFGRQSGFPDNVFAKLCIIMKLEGPRSNFGRIQMNLHSRRKLSKQFPIGLLTVAMIVTSCMFGWLAWNVYEAYRGFSWTTRRDLAQVEDLRGRILKLDEELTRITRSIVTNGDLTEEPQHRVVAGRLIDAVSRVEDIAGRASLSEIAWRVIIVNTQAGDMEAKMFNYVRGGRLAEARSMQAGEEYAKLHQRYSDAMSLLTRELRFKLGAAVSAEREKAILPITIGTLFLCSSLLAWLAVLKNIQSDRRVTESALTERAQLAALGADVGVSLAQGATLRDVLQGCAVALVRHLDVTFVRIWVLNPDSQVLDLQASAGICTELDGPQSRVPVGSLKIGLIALRRKPYSTNNVSKDLGMGDLEESLREGMVAFAGHPLSVDGRVVGVMTVFSKKPLAEFALHALPPIAHTIAVGIERKETERALTESEGRYRSLFEGNPLPMWVCEPATQAFLAVNDAAVKQYGYSRAEFRSMTLKDICPMPRLESPTSGSSEKRLVAGAGEYCRHRKKDGSILDVRTSSHEITIGQQTARLLIAEDVTERRRAEELRLAKEVAEIANRAKSRYLAHMSHELRIPLNTIIGYSELLVEQAADLDQKSLMPDLEKVRAAGSHLHDLINGILDFPRIEAGRMEISTEEFNIGQMLEEVVGTARTAVEKNANSLRICWPEDLGTMRSDLAKTRRVLLSLLNNAGKFTKEGVISFEASRRREDGEDWVYFHIRDTGIGMSAEKVTKLFDVFSPPDISTARSYGGAGLGLIISQRFCEMMGGAITVESCLGKGSTFTVRLPADVAVRLEQIRNTSGWGLY
jgi:PAS domain S-box-containing protein